MSGMDCDCIWNIKVMNMYSAASFLNVWRFLVMWYAKLKIVKLCQNVQKSDNSKILFELYTCMLICGHVYAFGTSKLLFSVWTFIPVKSSVLKRLTITIQSIRNIHVDPILTWWVIFLIEFPMSLPSRKHHMHWAHIILSHTYCALYFVSL